MLYQALAFDTSLAGNISTLVNRSRSLPVGLGYLGSAITVHVRCMHSFCRRVYWTYLLPRHPMFQYAETQYKYTEKIDYEAIENTTQGEYIARR